MNAHQGLYADPMIYDILHSPGTAREVTAFERVEALFAKGPLKDDRLWFEPACGTGRYLRVAARRGRRIAGFDWDIGQIEYARGRIKSGRGIDSPEQFYQADMRSFMADSKSAGYASHTADFAFNPVNSIRLLESNQEMLDHFSLYTTLSGKYGNPDRLDPERSVWESESNILALERPLQIKYMDRKIIEGITTEGKISASLSELSLEQFLDQF